MSLLVKFDKIFLNIRLYCSIVQASCSTSVQRRRKFGIWLKDPPGNEMFEEYQSLYVKVLIIIIRQEVRLWNPRKTD